LNISSILASSSTASAGDQIEISVELENNGLEVLECNVSVEIFNQSQVFESRKQNQKKVIVQPWMRGDKNKVEDGMESEWDLPRKSIKLELDAKEQLKWILVLPPNTVAGRYGFKIKCKDTETEYEKSVTQDLLEVKRHHEIQINDILVLNESFSVGDDAIIKVPITDTGTRAGDKLDIDYHIFDILNQDVYHRTDKFMIEDSEALYELKWPIPSTADAGKYDLEITISFDGHKMAARKFMKFITIEQPVKLDIHSMLPGMVSKDPDVSSYLMESEKIIDTIDHQALSIHKLNSNTHLYLVDNELITYSADKKTSDAKLQIFSNHLFSYSMIQNNLTQKNIKTELSYWTKMGYSWSNLLLESRDYLKLKDGDIKKLIEISRQKPSLKMIGKGSEIIFKNTLHKYKNDKGRSLKIDACFSNRLTADKEFTGSTDFKVLIEILKYLAGDASISTEKKKKISKTKSKRKGSKVEDTNIDFIGNLNSLFNHSLKFPRRVNSQLLQKKFNKILATWLNDLRQGKTKRRPNSKTWNKLRSVYGYLLTYLDSEICSSLSAINRKGFVHPKKVTELILNEILYYFLLMRYFRSQTKYDPLLTKEDVLAEINIAFNELKKVGKFYWAIHNQWQLKIINHLKNMSKRANLAFIREHVKITTNPIVLHGMRGSDAKTKLILGNNGTRKIGLQPYLALPSDHWNLVVPEAQAINSVYQLNRIVLSPKQTKEVSITVSFPISLSFQKYTGIMKLNSKPINLLPEIN
jgi:hypothetical protein